MLLISFATCAAPIDEKCELHMKFL